MDHVTALNEILRSYRIKATCVNYAHSDNYFYYDLQLLPQGRIRDLEKFLGEIVLNLRTSAKPSISILADKGLVRLSFNKERKNKLNLLDYFTNNSIPNGSINCLLGESVDGSKVWMDLAANPHLIVAGTTGSGKSCLLHNIIANLYNYNNVQLILIDPKNIEFGMYSKGMRNTYVGHTYNDALKTLSSLTELMNNRYDMLRKGMHISKLPYVVLIIDEFSDLIMQDKNNEFYTQLCTLAQKCRAAKIHIILSTQRPSVNVINGTIKANFPARICCQVSSAIDSRIVLDQSGGENLLGKGDAILKDNRCERFQIAYINPKDVCSTFGNL